eukprot:TRINITY_DN6979_c0_g1_i4.p1 TRINITY_DN6979_c0_g1~~TRINITY_DN6979_c0_g1_i4.p1  ORF type:complete len:633 (-),score=77.82 TRINITY_DN6979_c0_g1_i4:66-1964(-)
MKHLLLFTFLAVCAVSASQGYSLYASNPMLNIAHTVKDHAVLKRDLIEDSAQCLKDLHSLFSNFSEVSFKVVDYSGTSINDPGKYYECESDENVTYCAAEMDFSPIVPGIKDVKQGFCIPSSCNNETFMAAYNFLKPFSDFPLPDLTKLSCNGTMEKSTYLYAGYSICGILVLIVIIATIYDIITEPEVENGYHIINDDIQKERGFLGKLLAGFSMKSNYPRLFAPVPEETKMLNGIRVLAMFYVILGHTNAFLPSMSFSVSNNIWFFSNVYFSFSFQFIEGGFFAVDIFFYLSGFLVTYSLMKALNERGKLNLPLVYFHRWWRLTPVVGFMILFSMGIATYAITGPNRYLIASNPDNMNRSCEKWWWTNLLYINNVVPFNPETFEECIGWTWYLANDFQFFLITPIIMFIYKKKKLAGLGIILFLCLASFASIVGITLHFNLSYMDGKYFNYLYVSPWGRITPYLVGQLTALYILHRGKFQVRKVVRSLGMTFGLIIMLVNIYGTYKSNEWGMIQKIFYFTFSRASFCCGLGIITVYFYNGYGGVVKDFLSHDFWTPLARLTFSAYMIHPMVMQIIYVSNASSVTWSPYNVSIDFVGFVVLSYFCALLLYIFVEKPFMNVEKVVLERFQFK